MCIRRIYLLVSGLSLSLSLYLSICLSLLVFYHLDSSVDKASTIKCGRMSKDSGSNLRLPLLYNLAAVPLGTR